MTFNYQRGVNQDQEKWEEFNSFLSELSLLYSAEFEKDIYAKQRFMLISYSSTPSGIVYAFNDSVPEEMKNKILSKLKELFPNRL